MLLSVFQSLLPCINTHYEIPKGNPKTINSNADGNVVVDRQFNIIDSMENVFEISLCISENSVIILTSFPGI